MMKQLRSQMVFIFHKKIGKYLFMPVIVFLMPIFIGSLLQLLYYGIALIWVSVSFGLISLYINLQNEASMLDSLTKLYNREYLTRYLNYMLQKSSNEKQIAGIMYGPETVYRNGKAASKLSDLLISDDERKDYTYAAWNAVANNLKNPGSAEYPAMPTVSRHGDIVLVVGEVDAQNSFGATVRSTYRVKMQLPDKKILEFSMKLK